ncbi:MAG: ABC transporter permease [Gemmatimonadetes bacterium]|nr:ABC transporter permease [Gemmatimonadota bacterium]
MRDRRGFDGFLAWTAGPGTLYLALLFLAPMLLVAVFSVLEPTPGGGVHAALTLANYGRALDPLYLAVLGRSARLALITTALSLALAYPTAWAIRAAAPSRRGLLLALVIVPSWMNLLIKNYAWIVILRRQGVLNTLLLGVGVIDQPLPLLFTTPAVLVGLVHTYLPFMVLPLYVALDRMDWSLVEAARDLGAGPAQVFRRVVLPQTLASAAVGCTLVLVPALGAFVTPDLLGGPESLMVGTLIENQLLQVRNWPFASALSVLLMVVVLGVLAVVRRLAGGHALSEAL